MSVITLGIDEVGLGPLAGPLLLAAFPMSLRRSKKKDVTTPYGHGHALDSEQWEALLVQSRTRLTDSKKCSREQLLRAYELFVEEERTGFLDSAIFVAEPKEIDKQGIRVCWRKGVEDLVFDALGKLAEGDTLRVIVDGSDTADLQPMKQMFRKHHKVILTFEPKADANFPCVSAASMLAKAHRLRLMARIHKKHPEYSFDTNDGYGTAAHLAAIKTHGSLKGIHRFSFAKVKNNEHQ